MDKDTVIHYVEIDKSDASIYDEIEMKVRVKEIYEVNGKFRAWTLAQDFAKQSVVFTGGRKNLEDMIRFLWIFTGLTD